MKGSGGLQGELLEVVRAGHPRRRIADLLDGGHQQSDQDRKDAMTIRISMGVEARRRDFMFVSDGPTLDARLGPAMVEVSSTTLCMEWPLRRGIRSR